MSQIRALSIAAMSCAAALLLIAGSAGATTLTSPTGTGSTPTIEGESEGEIWIHSFEAKCQWAFEGTVEGHGEGKPAVLPLSSLTTSGCTNSSWQTKPTSLGKLEITWTSGYNGTVTWTGGTIEASINGVALCYYKSAETHFGTITGGSPATIHVNAAIPFEGGSFGCGSAPREITGSLKVTSPSSLYVDQ